MLEPSGLAPGSLYVLGNRELEYLGSTVKSIFAPEIVASGCWLSGGSTYGDEATTGVNEGSLLRRFLHMCMVECSCVLRCQNACGTSRFEASCPGEEIAVGGLVDSWGWLRLLVDRRLGFLVEQ